MRLRSHGLRASGPSRFFVSPRSPNAGVFVLPTITAPAARNRSTGMQSSAGTLSRKASEPYVVRSPRVSCRSLTPIGTPSSGAVSPLASRRSAASAAASAPSGSTVRKAPRSASRSIAASVAVTTSRLDTCRSARASRSPISPSRRIRPIVAPPSDQPLCGSHRNRRCATANAPTAHSGQHQQVARCQVRAARLRIECAADGAREVLEREHLGDGSSGDPAACRRAPGRPR